jgi:uncharacterized surface protein with fasciclin (FAS1) repeats
VLTGLKTWYTLKSLKSLMWKLARLRVIRSRRPEFEEQTRLQGEPQQGERELTMKLTKSIGRMIIARGALLSMLAVFGAQPLSAKVDVPGETAKRANIVETAVAAGQFKTLAAALEAAGLIDALTGEGPFTVFAPTDEAFAKLPAGTVESLLKPENKEKLKAILLYHVVSGNVTAKQVMKLNGRTVKTLEGTSIKVSTKHGVTVDDARVTKTDIQASNGVIHVVDTVLMPKM